MGWVEGSRLGTPFATYFPDTSRVSVNHITHPDGPLFHNHPWEFCWSIILHGGYAHEYWTMGEDGRPGPTMTREFKPGEINWMPHNLFHRVARVQPETYTQIFWGPSVPGKSSPGFWYQDQVLELISLPPELA